MEKRCVLVVDDDFDVRTSFQMVLELEGYEVHTANNGKEGLAFLRASATLPDLVILDLMMPVMNGYDFVLAVRADAAFQDLRILVASAGTLDCPIAGIQGFLPKPFLLDELLSACQKIMGARAPLAKTS